MKYDPKKADSVLLKEGDYSARIVKAEDKVSKAGNDMIEITLRIESVNGEIAYLRDWLLHDKPWKIKKIYKALGKESAFAAGEINASDLYEQLVTVLVTIEDNAKYGQQNRIKDYQRPTIQQEAAAAVADDGEIPF